MEKFVTTNTLNVGAMSMRQFEKNFLFKINKLLFKQRNSIQTKKIVFKQMKIIQNKQT